MKKHAYCIIAHNEPELLKNLLSLLDDERNDIFIHIDKKSNLNPEDFHVKNSHLTVLKEISVEWGSYNMIKVELLLFKTAHSNFNYSYYHLMSGVDLPLKSQDYIHQFFIENGGFEFVDIKNSDVHKKDLFMKTNYYWICIGKFMNPIKYFVYGFIKKSFIYLQKKIGIKRKYSMELYKGDQWCSLTNEFVEYLLSEEKKILKTFKYTSCPDEIYKQSWLMNSKFKDKRFLPLEESQKSNLFEIDWTRGKEFTFRLSDYKEMTEIVKQGTGKPYTWKMPDYEFLHKSNNLFARKFSSADIDIVNKISKDIK